MGGILQIHHCIRRSDQGLFACYAAAAAGVAVSRARGGQPVLRLIAGGGSGAVSNDSDNPDQPVAEALGVNVYAKQLVDGRDRAQLERLARYVLRLPLSQERLEWSADGRLQLTLKNVWKDGTRALLLEPHDLLARLCAAIPPPGFHLTTYWGVLSSHSSHRQQVVPEFADPGRFRPEPAAGDQLELSFDDSDPGRGRSRWGWLLQHVFRQDVETCERCGAPCAGWRQRPRRPRSTGCWPSTASPPSLHPSGRSCRRGSCRCGSAEGPRDVARVRCTAELRLS